jgi:hypothetical protein
MNKLPTDKFKPKPGRMYAHIFENPKIVLEPTLFYGIEIPLEPFDSGLDYVRNKMVETSFRLESILFPVTDWRMFDRQSFRPARDDVDGSIYIGNAHNPVDINLISFTRLGDFRFLIDCILFCDFESEAVAESTSLELSVDVEFEGLWFFSPGYSRERALEIASQLVDLSGYEGPESRELLRILFKPRI